VNASTSKKSVTNSLSKVPYHFTINEPVAGYTSRWFTCSVHADSHPSQC